MLLGYNTNGMAHHDLLSAIDVLADIGYRSVAITVDHHALNPMPGTMSWRGERRFREELHVVRERMQTRGLRSVIETGARFLLDPWHKHEPTLVSPDPANRARRIDFYRRCLALAKEMGSDCVSIWSGVLRDHASEDAAWNRLIDGLRPVLDTAAEQGVDIGFEPEPGMFVDTMDRFAELTARISHPHLRLTLDIGHLHCMKETPIADILHQYADQLVNVHIEDMKTGIHEHLMFGAGEIEFPPILDALKEIDYRGGVHVELSRHSHMAVEAAGAAYAFIAKKTAGRSY